MSLSANTLSKAFEEMYAIGCLTKHEEAKCRLIKRYYDKVSPRLLGEYRDLVAKGKTLFAEVLRDMMNKPNPFLALIPKEGKEFYGTYLPVPLKYGNEPKNKS